MVDGLLLRHAEQVYVSIDRYIDRSIEIDSRAGICSISIYLSISIYVCSIVVDGLLLRHAEQVYVVR